MSNNIVVLGEAEIIEVGNLLDGPAIRVSVAFVGEDALEIV